MIWLVRSVRLLRSVLSMNVDKGCWMRVSKTESVRMVPEMAC